MNLEHVHVQCTIGTQQHYTVLADHLMDIISKQRAIVYTGFVKGVALIAIALRERGSTVGATMARICLAMTKRKQ